MMMTMMMIKDAAPKRHRKILKLFLRGQELAILNPFHNNTFSFRLPKTKVKIHGRGGGGDSGTVSKIIIIIIIF